MRHHKFLECLRNRRQAQHRGLEVILFKDSWYCVDSFADDQLVMTWR